MPREIDLIAFDLDGTLVDSLADFADAMNRNLARYGFPERTQDEYRYIVGGGAYRAVEKSCPPGTDEHTLKTFWREFNADYAGTGCVKTRPYPGIPEALTALKTTGARLAVLTNKTHNLALTVLDTLFPPGTFEAVLGNTGEIALKPEADMGIWLCRELGVTPEGCAYVGDSGTDMTFARAAGFYAVGAAWGFRGTEELARDGAEVVLSLPGELAGCF